MSKSNPDSAIFMEDSADEVVRKIGKAHCPPGSEGEDANPCLAYFKVIVFSLAPTVTVHDSRTNAVIGDYTSYSQLAAAYAGGAIHPLDLKQCLAAAINTLLEPTRRHFATNPEAIKLHAAVVAAMTEHAAAGGAAGGAVGGAAGGAAGADAGASAAEPSV
jgi:tyrosyl-tRNA synthetase